jgi:hypothetical protein
MDAIDQLHATGRRVFSDSSMSDDAMRIWRETLPRLGYKVRSLGGKVERSHQGQLNTLDGRAHFEVLPRPDAPTARDAEAYAATQETAKRAEAYDALSPAEQVIADGGDAMFSMRAEPLRASELLERMKQKQAAAQETSKGLRAAAACAARHGVQGLRALPTAASFVSLRATAASALPSADAAIGQFIGMAYAVPLGITFAPMLAQRVRRDRQLSLAAASGAVDEPSPAFDYGEGEDIGDIAMDTQQAGPDFTPPEPVIGHIKPGQAVPPDAEDIQ